MTILTDFVFQNLEGAGSNLLPALALYYTVTTNFSLYDYFEFRGLSEHIHLHGSPKHWLLGHLSYRYCSLVPESRVCRQHFPAAEKKNVLFSKERCKHKINAKSPVFWAWAQKAIATDYRLRIFVCLSVRRIKWPQGSCSCPSHWPIRGCFL